MREQLIIWLTDDTNVQGAIFVENTPVLTAQAASLKVLLEKIPTRQSSQQVIIIVPGADVLLSDISVPPKQRRHLQKLLPFLVEAQLSEDIEQLHIVASAENANGITPVAVVRKSLIEHWLHILSDAGIEPDVLMPDTLALPLQTREWSLFIQNNCAWLRLELCNGSVVETGMLSVMLDLYLKKLSFEPVAVNCAYGGDSEYEYILSHIVPLKTAHSNLKIQIASDKADLFSTLCENLILNNDLPKLNLLSGIFASKKRNANSHGIWRNVAAIATFLLVTQLILSGVETAYLSVQANNMSNQSIALYRQLFPKDNKIINPAVQMKAHLNNDGHSLSDDNFFKFLGYVSAHLAPENAAGALQIKTINYNRTLHQLNLNVTSNRLAAINDLTLRMNTADMHAKLLSVVNESDGVKAQLLLEEIK